MDSETKTDIENVIRTASSMFEEDVYRAYTYLEDAIADICGIDLDEILD